jgi:polysaccharide export outer membrane protein
MRFWLMVCGVTALGLGCYHPTGSFVAVEAYRSALSGEYVIAAGDVLQVSVFQQEAMSARVKVRPDGRVSLPLVSELSAAGKTSRTLAAELEGKLKEFVNKPSVRVSVEETRALSVSIVGEVLRPGAATLETNAGVLQALAAGGGFTEFAHRDGIFVLRVPSGELVPQRIRFTWAELVRGQGLAAQFRLVAGDVVVVE